MPGTIDGTGGAPLIFPNSPYKRRRRIFYCLLSIEGEGVVPGLRDRSRRLLPPHGHSHATQHKSPVGVDTPPPYCQ